MFFAETRFRWRFADMILLGKRPFLTMPVRPSLPYDAEVEYIQSSGTQWIDTLVNPLVSPTVHIGLELINGNDRDYFGNTNAGGVNGPSLFIVDFADYKLQYYRYASAYSVAATGVISTGTFHDLIVGKSVYVDGTLTYTSSNTYIHDALQTNIMLFVSGRGNAASFRCSYFKLYDGDTLVRDFIPVRFMNELGQNEGAMYDRVSGQLFRNQGTGNFIVGRDTNPISARSYVNDGLVAMWDGIENAGLGKHSNAPTNWKNLVGAGDILLDTHFLYSFSDNELITTGQYGTNIQYNTVPIAASILNTTEWTIEVIAYAQSIYQAILRTYPWGTGGAFIFERGNNVTYLNLQDITGVKTFDGTGDTATGYMTAYTLRFSNNVLYRDWRVVGDVGRSDEIAWTKPALKTTDYSIGTNCHYHAIRLYNRALTAAEIAANYAIDKARFNLP